MYQEGEGVELVYSEEGRLEVAATWYELAADQGYSRALLQLSNMYRDGIGVEQDIEKSLKLLCKMFDD